MHFAHAAIAAVLAAVAIAPFAPASARQAQGASERSSGPTVDFIALNADGTPVPDLQASDVEIRIGDRVRAVRALRRVSAAPAPGPSSALRVPAPFGTNDDVAAGRRFLLVIDQESFAAGREQLFRDAIEGLLGEFTPADRALVAALPFGGVVAPYTSDIARIRQAARRVTGQGSRAETGSDLACRTRRFLESLDGLLRNGGVPPSPQTLVVFTAGLAGPRRDAPLGVLPGMCELQVDVFRNVGTAAGMARANVFILPPADTVIGLGAARPSIATDLGSDNPLEGIENLAGVTGGTRLPLDATGTASLLRVARESSAYYVAELEPVREDVIGRSRPLAVRASRRGVTMRARPEIAFAGPSAKGATRLTISELLGSGSAVTELPLRVGGFTVRDPDGKLRVGVLLEAGDGVTTLESAGAILIEDDTRVAARWNARDASERPLLGAMPATAGSYRLRAAAIDAGGRAGAAEVDIDVGLVQVGGLSLGSLLLGVSRGGTTVLQLQFGSEPTARASFDIYGGAEGQRLAASLEISRSLDGPALAAVPVALTRADDARVVATGTVPLGALAPGDYVLRGIVRLEDGSSGRVVRTLRKVS